MLWVIIHLALSIIAIYDVAKSTRDTTSKVLLIFLILSFPFVGPVIYLLVFKDKGYT
jgi:hypothetical protein